MTWKENLTKTLPGEALVIVSVGEGFIKNNLENIDPSLLPFYGIIILIAVFVSTIVLKHLIIGNVAANLKKKKITSMLLISFQALFYSLVIVSAYIFTGGFIILMKFIGIIAGLVLSVSGTYSTSKIK